MTRYYGIIPYKHFFDFTMVSSLAGMSEDEMARDLGFKHIADLVGESIFIDNPNWIPRKLNEFLRSHNIPLRITPTVPKKLQEFVEGHERSARCR